MRYFVLLIAIITALSAGLDWPSDYNEALRQAAKEKKDVYIFLGSEYCPFCEKFKKEVLSKDEVIKKLKKDYVLVYLSRDIDDIPPHLEVRPVPRHYFLTKKGEIIYSTMGSRSKEGFYELLDEVKEAKK